MLCHNEYGQTSTGLTFTLFWKWGGCWKAAVVNSRGRTLAEREFFAHPDVPHSVEAAHQAATEWITRQLAN